MELMSKRTLYNREFRRKNNAAIRAREIEWRNSRPLYYAVKRAKIVAKEFGLLFDLDDRKIAAPEFCPVLGLKLRYGVGHGPVCDSSPSLDRIRPERGYVLANVRIISHRANTIKSNATPAELRAVADDLETVLDKKGWAL
jgi:hypothetical protein